MKNESSLEGSVARMHAVTVAMGRLGPLRDPISEGLALDLTAGQVHVLMRLGHDGPLTMGLLSSRIGITLPGCTRLVDRMKDAGQVLRERDTEDRRVVVVRLAAAGRRLFDQIDASVLVKIEGILSLLEPADRQQFVAILEKLHDGIVQKMAELPDATETTP